MIINIFEKVYTKIYIKLSKVKQNKIVFDNFRGKGYGDNPKYICEEILNRTDGFDIVWLSNSPSCDFPEGVRIVKYGSQKALRELATARIWIDNIRNTYKPAKKNGQLYLQTWHGSYGPKPSEGDALEKLSINYIDSAKKDGSITDAIISDCDLQTQRMKSVFWLNDKTEILEYGMPRNDSLIKKNFDSLYKNNVKKTIGVNDRYVVLYAPTFRDDLSSDGYIFNFDNIISAFEKRFKSEVVVLVRLHPNDTKNRSMYTFSERIIDVTDYSNAQDLSLISDCLITDYSSIFIDFLLLRKCAFFMAKDLSTYREQRGIMPDYFDYPYSVSNSVDSLVCEIEKYDSVKQKERIDQFLNEHRFFADGNSSQKVVDWLFKKIGGNDEKILN